MKCDELKAETIVPQGCTITLQMYPKAEADAAIAELKARIQLDDDEMAGFLQLEEECGGGGDLRNYIAELKAENERLKKCEIWMKQHFYCEEVIACESAKNRQLKRALWLARALRARDIQSWWISATCAPITERACSVWNNVERKCRAKAEEYK